MKNKLPLLILISCFTVSGCKNNEIVSGVTNPELKDAILLSPTAEEGIIKPSNFDDFINKVDVFSARFTQSIVKSSGTKENIGIAPISVFLALAMCVESSNGETRDEILNAFHMSYEELTENIEYLCYQLNTPFSYESMMGEKFYGQIKLTNSIWFDKSLTVKEKYLSVLSDLYNSYSFQVDFAHKNRNANRLVREFIKEQTNGMIDKSLELDTSTLVVLLNTLYFKDTWNDLGENMQFTKDQYVFRNENNESYKQALLSGYYNPGRVLESDCFKYFYTTTNQGYKLSFIVPTGNNTLSEIINSETINEVVNAKYQSINSTEMKEYFTRCYFPEFETEFSENIENNLKNDFNIKKMFTEQSDMSNVTDDIPLHVDEVKHIVKFNVDKTGIEGAAITAVSVCGEVEPIYEKVYETFVVDRSFGFTFSTPNNIVLFSGTVNKL